MRILSVVLEHIRSYVHETITFQEGSTLLHGDIGSGKSTVLLAIEFALFGTQRTELTGSSLLRHGEREGSVKLSFTVQNKEYTIKRGLKRTQGTVIQTNTELTIDENTILLTPMELKEKIFSILGYPKELLQRQQNLIYRYTVYTPQEQLKQIIYESPEVRMDLLRRIFRIDRYKVIEDLVSRYTRYLRESIREHQGMLVDLPSLEQKEKLAAEELKTLTTKIAHLNEQRQKKKAQEEQLSKKHKDAQERAQNLQQAREDLLRIKKTIQHHQQEIEGFRRQQKELEDAAKEHADKLLSAGTPPLRTSQKTLQDEITHLEKRQREQMLRQDRQKQQQILLQKQLRETTDAIVQKEKSAASWPKTAKTDTGTKDPKQVLTQKQDMEQKLQEARGLLAKIQGLLEQSKALQDEIMHLDTCPTCLQEVSDAHKEQIRAREQDKQQGLGKRQAVKQEESAKLAAELAALEKQYQQSIEHSAKQQQQKDILALHEQLRKEVTVLKEKKEQLALEQSRLQKEEETKAPATDFNEQLSALRMQKEIALRIRHLHEQKELIEKNLKQTLNLITARQQQLDASKEEMHEKEKMLEGSKAALDLLEQLQKEMQTMTQERSMQERTLAQEQQRQKDLAAQHKELSANLAQKQDTRRYKERMERIHTWLEQRFLPLVEHMEKTVLMQAHRLFESTFRSWFAALIEDEGLQVRLGESFDPQINHQGYDTSFQQLSGGEKTSLALSYRLALTTVINTFVHTIRTQQIIILDEPTDGFSSQQLDKLKEIFDELSFRQIIVVSHESKVENFVQHIISIRKKENTSILE